MSNSVLTSTVITDGDGQTWNNGIWAATLISPNGSPTVSGTPVAVTSYHGAMSSVGAITATVTDTSSIDQAGAKWMFTLIPNASVSPVQVLTAVTGATPNLSTTLSAGLLPRFFAGESAFGYRDAEVIAPVLGASYFNVTDNCIHKLTINGWDAAAAGTGSVTTVSVVTANGVSGSVAGASTTPAITLTLGAITPTSTNGVPAATMAYMDATSGVQAQLNGKQASGTYVTPTTLSNGTLPVTATTLAAALATPASAVATGVTGTLAFDAGFIYVCINTNTWVRVATATWS